MSAATMRYGRSNRVALSIDETGRIHIEQQDYETEVEIRDYRSCAPQGKHRVSVEGHNVRPYRSILFPAPRDHDERKAINA